MKLERKIKLEQTVDNITEAFHVDAIKDKAKEVLDYVSSKVEVCMDKVEENKVLDKVITTAEDVGGKLIDITGSLINRVVK